MTKSEQLQALDKERANTLSKINDLKQSQLTGVTDTEYDIYSTEIDILQSRHNELHQKIAHFHVYGKLP